MWPTRNGHDNHSYCVHLPDWLGLAGLTLVARTYLRCSLGSADEQIQLTLTLTLTLLGLLGSTNKQIELTLTRTLTLTLS